MTRKLREKKGRKRKSENDYEEKSEEKEEEEIEEKFENHVEKHDDLNEIFLCKHCESIETIGHWSFICPHNPIDVEDQLLDTLEKEPNDINKEKTIRLAKSFLATVRLIKDEKKKARCLRGNLSEINLPKVGKKIKLKMIKALKTLILARWHGRCVLKHSSTNPFTDLNNLRDSSSKEGVT